MNIRQGIIFSFEEALKMQPKSRLKKILDTLDLEPVLSQLKEPEKTNRGPYGYSYHALLNALIAMRLENMNGFTQLVERLTYDPYLRYVCGFEPFGNVPSVSTFSRFYARLARTGVLELLFNSLVEKAEKMGLIDTSTVAIDSTKLEAYEKSVPKKDINQNGRSADWGIKSDTNGNPIKWFGYKLHAVCEVRSGLPLALHVTPASTHDKEAVKILLKKCHENIENKPGYYVMDAAYDDREIYDLVHKEYHAQAIIPLNRRNAKQPKAGFDWDGTPVCSAGYRMVYWGSSGGKNKFRCPHILGKCDCPFGSAWCSESNYGLVVKTSVKQDPRLFTVPHRGTKNWNRLYNLRTFTERCFARFKENLGLETGLKLGEYDKVKAHAYLCAITMYAAVIAVNQRYQNQEKLAV